MTTPMKICGLTLADYAAIEAWCMRHSRGPCSKGGTFLLTEQDTATALLSYLEELRLEWRFAVTAVPRIAPADDERLTR